MRGDTADIGMTGTIRIHEFTPSTYVKPRVEKKYVQKARPGSIRERIILAISSIDGKFSEPQIREQLQCTKSNCAAMVCRMAKVGIIKFVGKESVNGKMIKFYVVAR